MISLASDSFASRRGPVIPIGYRFCRGLIRLWFALSFGKIRLLHAEILPASGAALLAVSHPGSFLDALILVAAFDRQVHCVVDRKSICGPLRSLLARSLGMIPREADEKGWKTTLEACCGVLKEREALVVFAEQRPAGAGEQAGLTVAPATIALEAESRHSGQLGLTLFPVHLFLPVARSQSSELLIHVDSPVYAQEYSPPTGGELPPRIRALATVLEEKFRGNAFRLQPEDVRLFLSDLEEALRSDLEEDWTSRPNWKQKTEGFQLSRFVTEWAEQVNYLNPGRLVAMRESLDAFREARRRWSLRQLEVEAAGAWLLSPWRRAAVWFESAAGLGLALYGLLNHLLIGLLLYGAGLLKKQSRREQATEWLIRALVVLGFYVVQVLLCAYLLGRAWAGYYAPTLPLSGAYLWRYAWLLGHRTRPAFLALTLPAQAAKVRRMRKEMMEELNRILNIHAEMLGVAR
jgi:1-acyl-sn-glycerol-3-phosphate acyltransferase